MNLAEYSKALGKLPMIWKVLPFSDVSVTRYEDKLILCHAERTPIYYWKGSWYEMQIITVAPVPA